MAQGLAASNKNGCFQIDFGTLVWWGFPVFSGVFRGLVGFSGVWWGFPDFSGVFQDFPNYGAVIFV